MSKGIQIAAGAIAIALLLGWYAADNLGEGSFVYYQTLDEFRAHGEAGDNARVHGYVANGSIERDVAGHRVHFVVQESAPHAGGSPEGGLAVVYASLETPDLFKDGAEVVVEGRLTAPGGTFEASNVLAKCPSKFEAAAAGTGPAADARGEMPPGAAR